MTQCTVRTMRIGTTGDNQCPDPATHVVRYPFEGRDYHTEPLCTDHAVRSQRSTQRTSPAGTVVMVAI